MEKDAHVSVLLTEAVDALGICPESQIVDATFGRGGHSREILKRLGSQGRLIAIDRDHEAIAHGSQIEDKRFTIVHGRFSEIDDVLAGLNIHAVDGVLLDIGVSSPQLDDASRGFSFREDGVLDMRMDPGTGESARQWLARAEVKDIYEVLRDYGEERFAKQIAQAIVDFRQSQRLDTTGQLAQLVASVVRTRERGQNPATRTFQAIRIFINRELEELQIVLPKAFDLLNPGGRLSVISFHSLEDRIVKRWMRSLVLGKEIPSDLPLRDSDLPSAQAKWVVKRALVAEGERSTNRRARSAVLRAIEKIS